MNEQTLESCADNEALREPTLGQVLAHAERTGTMGPWVILYGHRLPSGQTFPDVHVVRNADVFPGIVATLRTHETELRFYAVGLDGRFCPRPTVAEGEEALQRHERGLEAIEALLAAEGAAGRKKEGRET